jgi:predicted aspartyl protease
MELQTKEVTMRRFAVDMEVSNNTDVQAASIGALTPDKVRKARLRGVVDSGAAKLVLPASTAAALGLHTIGEATVKYADQRVARRPLVEEVCVELQGRHGTFSAIVEPDRTTALIGAIVLEDLDFPVDSARQRLVPRDPDRIVSEIE